VERSGVVGDDQNDDADFFVGEEGHLGMKARKIATMVGDEMSAIGGGLAAHAVIGIENFPEAQGVAKRVRQADGRLERSLEDVWGKHLLALVLAVVHQRDQPV